MVDFKRIEDDIYVCGQVSEADVKEAADLGVKLLINNRPDGEDKGQATSDEVAAWAEARAHNVQDRIPVQQKAKTGSFAPARVSPKVAICSIVIWPRGIGIYM